MAKDENTILCMGDLLDGARKPRAMLENLGLQKHPGYVQIKGNWNSEYRNLVCRSDPWPRYRQVVHVTTYDEGPPLLIMLAVVKGHVI